MSSRSQMVEVFNVAAATYEATGTSYLDPMGARLVDLAGITEGQRVLDVGTGRGAVLRPAARTAGPSGFVLGLDTSARMAAMTHADLTGQETNGGARAAVVIAEASAPPVADQSVDAVLGGMLAQFLPDPATALRAWAVAVVPGGRLGLSWWAGEDERYERVGLAAACHLRHVGPYVPRAFSGDVPATEALVGAAGWGEVTTVVETQQVRFADTGAWWRWSWSHGQRRRWQRVADLEALRRDVDAELDLLAEDDASLLYQPRAAFTLDRAPH